MLMPLMLIAQAIATASLPTFSAQAALGKLDEMRNSLSAAIRTVLLLSLPAAVGMILLRFPLIRLMYENGTTFTSQSTELVAWALLWYTIGLVGHSLVEIISRAFYAMQDTKTPVLVGVAVMSLNIILSLILGPLFLKMGWLAIGGLALANSIATGLESIILLIIMRKRLKGLEGAKIFQLSWKIVLAVSAMGVVIWWMVNNLRATDGLVLLISVVMGVVIYAVGLLVFKVGEFTALTRMFVGKFLRR
jgi:putative peptidoglycan lipid II flippase